MRKGFKCIISLATNIALSANLIDSTMLQIMLTSDDQSELLQKLESTSDLIVDAIHSKQDILQLKENCPNGN